MNRQNLSKKRRRRVENPPPVRANLPIMTVTGANSAWVLPLLFASLIICIHPVDIQAARWDVKAMRERMNLGAKHGLKPLIRRCNIYFLLHSPVQVRWNAPQIIYGVDNAGGTVTPLHRRVLFPVLLHHYIDEYCSQYCYTITSMSTVPSTVTPLHRRVLFLGLLHHYIDKYCSWYCYTITSTSTVPSTITPLHRRVLFPVLLHHYIDEYCSRYCSQYCYTVKTLTPRTHGPGVV